MASIIKANELQDFGGNSIITSDGAGTITLSSGMNTAVAAGTNNTPAFHAYKSSNDNSVTDNTYVKVTLESELLDSDGAWDVSTSKFTPQVAGKYLIMAGVYLVSDSTSTLRNSYTLIYKNGSEVGYARNGFQANDITLSHVTYQAIVDMNGSTDYVELYAAIDITSGTPYFGKGSKSTYMCGYKIIGA